MSDRIPELIDPYQLVEKNRGYKGFLNLSRLKRLLPSLKDASGSVAVEIQFARDESGQRIATGNVKADLELECQRCMQAMLFPVEIKLRLGIVRTVQEAERLPEKYEPLVVDEPMMAMADIIEDELILALPNVPMHREDECSVKSSRKFGQEDQIDQDKFANNGSKRASEAARENPFAVLKQLKTNPKE